MGDVRSLDSINPVTTMFVFIQVVGMKDYVPTLGSAE